MIGRISAIAAMELRVSVRNRWIATAVLLMSVFSGLLAFAGSAPAGSLGVDLMTITASNLTTLAVYLVPLIALLMSYDAIVGERDRGTLALLLTYPIGRHELLIGKFTAQLITLAIATAIGFGIASLIALWFDGWSRAGLNHIARLWWTSVLLGAAFIAIGTLIGTRSKQTGSAAAYAIAIWIIAVVMFDVALLASLIADDGGYFTVNIFPWLLAVSPADAFRVFNVTAIEDAAAVADLTTVAQGVALPQVAYILSLVLWPVIALTTSWVLMRRIEV